jgi:hypothetical protein
MQRLIRDTDAIRFDAVHVGACVPLIHVPLRPRETGEREELA